MPLLCQVVADIHLSFNYLKLNIEFSLKACVSTQTNYINIFKQDKHKITFFMKNL